MQEEQAGHTTAAGEGVFRIDMHECPSKGFLLRNRLGAYHDYCEHCMGWMGPMLKEAGFAADHEHNHSGQCWWEIRRASDNAAPSEPGKLASSDDVRMQPARHLPHDDRLTGAPKMAGTHEVHGAPLRAEEAKATRAALGWEHGAFEVPADARAAWDAKGKGQTLRSEWESMFARYRTAYPTEAAEFERRMRGELPSKWAGTAQALLEQARGVTAATATRKSSQQALERLVAEVPELLGGSADLTWSNLTAAKASRPLDAAGGNYVHYGVREFGMAAIMNGAALHGGFIPCGGTFAVFSDYARSGIRMSALMKQRVVYVLTHDSIGLGEDGPTHQPVEHATALRVVPNLEVNSLACKGNGRSPISSRTACRRRRFRSYRAWSSLHW